MSKVLEPQEEENNPRNQDEEDHHQKTSKKEEFLDQSLCTPTSSDHKIPEIETCPPPPRKRPREVSLTRMKKLSKDLKFFEATDVGSQEVETLFVDNQNHVHKKRRSSSA